MHTCLYIVQAQCNNKNGGMRHLQHTVCREMWEMLCT